MFSDNMLIAGKGSRSKGASLLVTNVINREIQVISNIINNLENHWRFNSQK
jgi:hypothetical protein